MRLLSYLAYVPIPLAYLVHFWIGRDKSWEPVATFALAGVGVIPLAKLMGDATEQLSEHAGPTWGGLLNATFGNAAELIIGFIALHKGLNEIVKASLTGSILGNLLLVSGAAMVAGGWNREKQTYSKANAQTSGGPPLPAGPAECLPPLFSPNLQNYHAGPWGHQHPGS